VLFALLAIATLALLVYAVLDVLRTPTADVHGLPKALWLLVVLVPVAGGVAWLRAGRPESHPATSPRPYGLRRPSPGRGPDDDEAFLRRLRERAERQRRAARDGTDPDA